MNSFVSTILSLTALVLINERFIPDENGESATVKKEYPKKEVERDVLKEKATFGIGAAVQVSQLMEPPFANTVKKHFSQVTAEWEMKMESIWSSSSAYDWTAADRIVGFAEENDLDVHGHTLVWYRSFPAWFRNAGYDSAAFEDKVKAYIKATVSRYKGKVKSWDVANEVFYDNGTLRSANCQVYATFKDPVGFYGRCFRYAHEADPDAKLFYNDYSVVIAEAKRNAIKNMVNRFKHEGIPIHGIADQFHYRVTTDTDAIKAGLKDMASLGLLIHISELDIIVNTQQDGNYVFTEKESQKQSDTYKFVVEAYESLPESQKFAITTWGVTDQYTWLTTDWHAREYPLLFDGNYQEKKAYYGFLAGLK